MSHILMVIMLFFWLILIYYSVLTVAGIVQRIKSKPPKRLAHYPSVDILIPAYNEEVVLKETLEAMCALEYPGELNVFLLDDGSTDRTGEIAKAFAKLFSRIHYVRVPPGTPKGKSRVLNYGLSITDGDYVVVYDADNRPEPSAVRLLVEAAEGEPGAAGAVGYVKTINARTNLLTRMIALEFQVFQLLMQSGRWQLLKLGSLPGTNMLLKRDVLDQSGWYDPWALAEDAELTMRISTAGYTLPVVAEAVTWEQEPENIKTFIKQRTRWLMGNLYLLEKSFLNRSYWKKKALLHSLHHVLIYFLFAFLLLFSHVTAMMGLAGLVDLQFSVPILMLWQMSYVVYTFQLIGALVLNRQASLINCGIALIMYFTYAQTFIIILLRSLVLYVWKRHIQGQNIEWDKTIRFKGRAI